MEAGGGIVGIATRQCYTVRVTAAPSKILVATATEPCACRGPGSGKDLCEKSWLVTLEAINYPYDCSCTEQGLRSAHAVRWDLGEGILVRRGGSP